jgi:hypothetical protein
MKKRGLLWVVLVFFLMAGIGHAATITAVSTHTDVLPGETFMVRIVGQGFEIPDSNRTMGGDSLLEFDGNAFGTAEHNVTITWPGNISGATVEADSVFVSAGNIFSPPIGPDFGIADIVMTVMSDAAPGNYDLALTVSNWVDGEFDLISPQPEAFGTSVNVAVIPIPSAIFLLGGGLISLFAVRRRRS